MSKARISGSSHVSLLEVDWMLRFIFRFVVRGCLLGFIESALGFDGFTPRSDISSTRDVASTFAPAEMEVLLFLERVHGICSRA